MGWLKVVGAGIRTGQLTYEAERAIRDADVVLCLLSNSTALEMVRSYNENIVDLQPLYVPDGERLDMYRAMASRALREVRDGKNVAFAIYGHPLVFALPGRLAVDQARSEGYDAVYLPGISATDSMFCDLEIDPAVHGFQVYCATRFVDEERPFDPHSILTLWQLRVIGESRLRESGSQDHLGRLCDRLEAAYGLEHPVTLYEAAILPFLFPDISTIPLASLRSAEIRPCCTVVIPPLSAPDLIRVGLREGFTH